MPEAREELVWPLLAAEPELARLRTAEGDPERLREAILRLGEAVDATLRRVLRDDRPGEHAAAEVVVELRQKNRVSLEFAGAFHELLRIRERAREGGVPSPHDAALAVDVAERLRREVLEPPTQPTLPPPADRTLPIPPVAPVPAPRSGVPPLVWVLLAAAVLLVAGWWLWQRADAGKAELAEAITLFRSGDYTRAEPRFRSYVEAHPDDATARLYLARIERRTGEWERAAEELREGLRTAPDDAGLQRELGFLLLEVGRAPEAAERFREALRLDPEAPDGWAGLVRALRAVGRPEAAERVLERAPPEVEALLRSRTGG
ncbi:hypothetical protein BH23GEM4_BH23GEM4_16550 [soil metagenome]